MMRDIIRFPSGLVKQTSGTEGSRHDPWSFREVTVIRDGDRFVAHLGLGLTITWPGGTEHFHVTRDLSARFLELTGLSLASWERLFQKEADRRWKALSKEQRHENELMEEYDARLLRYAQ